MAPPYSWPLSDRKAWALGTSRDRSRGASPHTELRDPSPCGVPYLIDSLLDSPPLAASPLFRSGLDTPLPVSEFLWSSPRYLLSIPWPSPPTSWPDPSSSVLHSCSAWPCSGQPHRPCLFVPVFLWLSSPIPWYEFAEPRIPFWYAKVGRLDQFWLFVHLPDLPSK